MMRSLPWLVALPDSVGDPIIGTALLNKIAQHIGEQTGLVVVCAERLVPILGEQRGVSHCFAYGPAAQTAVANAPFEWVIDLWSTETSHHVLQYASGQRRAFRSIEDPMLMQVGEATFPASAFNPALGGRAANPHEPAWALEGALVAKVLGEDLWGWVDDGVEPRLHYRMPHEKFACRAAIHRPYAVLLPCGHPSKHWPMASYLKLGGRLSQLGFEVHLSLGPNESSGSAKDMWAAGDFVFHGPMNLRGWPLYCRGLAWLWPTIVALCISLVQVGHRQWASLARATPNAGSVMVETTAAGFGLDLSLTRGPAGITEVPGRIGRVWMKCMPSPCKSLTARSFHPKCVWWMDAVN